MWQCGYASTGDEYVNQAKLKVYCCRKQPPNCSDLYIVFISHLYNVCCRSGNSWGEFTLTQRQNDPGSFNFMSPLGRRVMEEVTHVLHGLAMALARKDHTEPPTHKWTAVLAAQERPENQICGSSSNIYHKGQVNKRSCTWTQYTGLNHKLISTL